VTSDRDRWDARHMAADDADPAPSELLDAYAAHFPDGGRALDLACGRGRNAVHLARLGFVVDAVDVSTIALAKTRTLAERRGVADLVHAIEHDLEDGLPRFDEPFDVVLCLHFRRPALWPLLPSLVDLHGMLMIEVLARDATNLDVNPEYLAERDELLAAASGLDVVFHGRALAGKRVTDALIAVRREL